MNSSFRQGYWYLVAYLKKYARVLVITVILVIGLGWLSVRVAGRLSFGKPTEYQAIIGRRQLTEIPEEIARDLGLGITSIDEEGLVQPGLATRWEVAEEGRKYRFYIDLNHKWSDGSDLKLADIDLKIEGVTVNKVEPNIIEFVLPEPFSPFPSLLARPVIKGGTYGVGEYSITEVRTVGQFLDRVVIEGASSRRIYDFFDSESLAITAFRLGEVDHINGVTSDQLLEEGSGVEITPVENRSTLAVLFMNNKDAKLSEKSLRQGLSYAIKDKSFGHSRALGPFVASSYYYNPALKSYNYDQARAAELLKTEEPLKLTLSTEPQFLQIAETIARDWQEFGVETEVKVISTRPDDYQIYLGTMTTLVDPDQYQLWHSTQAGTNHAHVSNPKVDKLLEDGRKELDVKKRKVIYDDFQRFLVEDAHVVFLFYPDLFTVSR